MSWRWIIFTSLPSFMQRDLRRARAVRLEVLARLLDRLRLHAGEDRDHLVGFFSFISDRRRPGRAPPAAQPQTEFTKTSVVPGCLTARRLRAGVLSSLTPRRVTSSRIGWTRSGSYMSHVSG